MEKILVDKDYILNRMAELKQSPILQEYVYLQGLLKEAAKVETTIEDKEG